ncbi:unnamed protein product [Anisakis simplex]|uniref:Helicase ATP-binding domain-containing protein n=1 Tax=Anisakis simplex TaxID=6269 RepID=A0A0M3JY27_ANISI|nr:unnamed protein product [Anisakis simplex]
MNNDFNDQEGYARPRLQGRDPILQVSTTEITAFKIRMTIHRIGGMIIIMVKLEGGKGGTVMREMEKEGLPEEEGEDSSLQVEGEPGSVGGLAEVDSIVERDKGSVVIIMQSGEGSVLVERVSDGEMEGGERASVMAISKIKVGSLMMIRKRSLIMIVEVGKGGSLMTTEETGKSSLLVIGEAQGSVKKEETGLEEGGMVMTGGETGEVEIGAEEAGMVTTGGETGEVEIGAEEGGMVTTGRGGFGDPHGNFGEGRGGYDRERGGVSRGFNDSNDDDYYGGGRGAGAYRNDRSSQKDNWDTKAVKNSDPNSYGANRNNYEYGPMNEDRRDDRRRSNFDASDSVVHEPRPDEQRRRFGSPNTRNDNGPVEHGGFGRGSGFGARNEGFGEFSNMANRDSRTGFGDSNQSPYREPSNFSQASRGFSGDDGATFGRSDYRRRDENRFRRNSFSNDRAPGAGYYQERRGGRSRYFPEDRAAEEMLEEDEANAKYSVDDIDLEVTLSGKIPDQYRKFMDWEEEIARVNGGRIIMADALIKNIQKHCYKKPRAIQAAVIPLVWLGCDVLGHAETGSGKSLAFILPIIDMIMQKELHKSAKASSPIALIVAPTRELINQLYNQTRKMADGTGVQVAQCYGQIDFSRNVDQIRNGCHILLATMGRLLHLVNRDYVSRLRPQF